MGCEQSVLNSYNKESNHFQRKNRKKQTVLLERFSKNQKILKQNVKKSQLLLTIQDIQIAEKVIKNHYLFFKLSQTERKIFISNFQTYETPQNQFIFKKGDAAALFFIIKSGRVAIHSSNQQTQAKQLGRGQSFGQLSLIYTSPRSATVKTLQKCEFLCISNNVFRSTMQSLTKKSFQQAILYINKITVFKYLTSKQKTTLAHNINSLKFNKGDIIFNGGDDSNSFFIIIKGKVRLQIPNKLPIVMVEGQTFGQSSLQKKQVRSGTSICQTQVHLLSISKQTIIQCLNGQIRQIVYYNIMKWSLKRLNAFKKFSNLIIQKIIKKCEIKQFKDGQIIANKGDPVTALILCLEGKINGEQPGFIFNSEYLIDKKKQQKKVQSQSIIKQGSGNVCFFYINIIENQFFGSLQDIVRKSSVGQDLIEMATLKRYQLSRLKLSDLKIIKKIGIGNYSTVYEVQDQCGNHYALKCLKKASIIEKQMQMLVKQQKQVLQVLQNPFVATYYKTFKDKNHIYYLMKLIQGKDFYQILRQIGLLNQRQAAFYLGCLILALEYLHNKNIVHRDLKPQNIVLDKNGYLILTDFGTSKILKEEQGYRTYTIIGTPHYLAPEVLEGKGHSFPVDIWALGIILFQMVCGRLPYGQHTNDPIDIYKQIIKSNIKFPKYYNDNKGKPLIQNLLIRQQSRRNIEQFAKLKTDPYFQNINWFKLKKRKVCAPYYSTQKEIKDDQIINNKLIDYLDELNKQNPRKNIVSKYPRWDQDF